jgi:DNA-directed RNA polymerase subunit K/omega
MVVRPAPRPASAVRPFLPPRARASLVPMNETTPQVPEQPEAPVIPPEPLPPIQSRFLFVDVAALRAKQLRRGARVRIDDTEHLPKKAERVAMEEVRRGLVYYNVPAPKPPRAESHE